MKEKTYGILLVVLAVLLAISILLNVWLLYTMSVQNPPTNPIPGLGGYPCKTDADCFEGGANTCKSCDECASWRDRQKCIAEGGHCCIEPGLPF